MIIIGLGAIDQFELNSNVNDDLEDAETIERNNYILGNLPVSAQWNYAIGAKWTRYARKGYQNFVLSRNMLNNQAVKFQDNVESDANKNLDYSSREMEYKFRYEHIFKSKGWNFKYGLGLEAAKYTNSTFNKIVVNVQVLTIYLVSKIDFLKYGVFFQTSKTIKNRLTLSLGLKSDANSNSEEMSNLLEQFSIKDLENLSGIKAHTIRIWEQRYKLLEPNRSETNIRTYPNKEYVKLLNISMLNANGIKISKISTLSEAQIETKLNALIEIENNYFGKQVNDLLVAMVNLDLFAFNSVYNTCRVKYSFSDVFLSILIPLFDKIGVLWQTNSILSAHESFISNLVRQKLYTEIDKVSKLDVIDKSNLFVIFLSLNEIHDLGALFMYYKLLFNHKYVIYLGVNINEKTLTILEDLEFNKITYLMHGTTEPGANKMSAFAKNLKSLLKPDDKFFLAGRKGLELFEQGSLDDRFNVIKDLSEISKLFN